MKTKTKSDNHDGQTDTDSPLTGDIKNDLAAILKAAYAVSEDVGKEVEAVIEESRQNPLKPKELADLLTSVITKVQRNASRRGDKQLARSLEGNIEELVNRIVALREAKRPKDGSKPKKKLTLIT